jgi:Sulfatase
MRCLVGLALLAACGDTKRAPPPTPTTTTTPTTPTPTTTTTPSDASPIDKPSDAAPDAAVATKPARVEHVAFDFVDNRHAAHRAIAGELVVDAGDIGFARFTRFGLPAPYWHIGHVIDGERASIAERFASVEVPLPVAAHETAQQITMRVHADVKQSVVVRVGSTKVATIALDPGWQVVAVPVAKGGFAVGENAIAFETLGKRHDATLALAWLRIGTSHPIATDAPLAAATFDAKAGAFSIDRDAELAWYVTLPDGADLVAHVAAPCRVEVAARAGDDSLVGGMLSAEHDRVDLSASAGKVVRLALIARDCPRATVTHAAITLHGDAPAPVATTDPPRFVIVWVMGSMRGDRMPGAHTPSFDELVRSSTRFDVAYAQGNESQASYASLWTSLYPAVHGVRLAGPSPRTQVLAERFETLASELGIAALGATSSAYLADRRTGFQRGFTQFVGSPNPIDAAIGLLGGVRDKAALLFIGTTDGQKPFDGNATQLGIKPGAMGCSVVPPAEVIARLREVYDSEVAYDDAQLGRLVTQLKTWGLWDQTMLIVTSDHGEELFEDGRCGHGTSLRESVVRVPLVIHDPARFPAGTAIDDGVELIDVLPTIEAALGKPVLATSQGQGRALEPLVHGAGAMWPRPAYASMFEYAHAMRIGRWKIRVGQTALPLVDDVISDPGETVDMTAKHPVERRMLTDNLGLFLALRARWQNATWGETTNVTAAGAAALDSASTP